MTIISPLLTPIFNNYNSFDLLFIILTFIQIIIHFREYFLLFCLRGENGKQTKRSRLLSIIRFESMYYILLLIYCYANFFDKKHLKSLIPPSSFSACYTILKVVAIIAYSQAHIIGWVDLETKSRKVYYTLNGAIASGKITSLSTVEEILYLTSITKQIQLATQKGKELNTKNNFSTTPFWFVCNDSIGIGIIVFDALEIIGLLLLFLQLVNG